MGAKVAQTDQSRHATIVLVFTYYITKVISTVLLLIKNMHAVYNLQKGYYINNFG